MSNYLLGGAKASVAPWLTLYPITQSYGQNGETGVDLGTPFGTPITALVTGKILGTGVYGGGAVVSQELNLNGQPAALYYQHLDRWVNGIQAGVMVNAGQLIGYSGGQLSGGTHPSTRQFSTGPHLEVGINAPYGSFWNPYNYGPNVNPIGVLTQLLAGIPSSAQLSSVTAAAQAVAGNVGAATITVTTAPGFGPLAESLHNTQAFVPVGTMNLMTGFTPSSALTHDVGAWIARALFVGAGSLIVGAVLVSAAKEQATNAAQTVGQVAGAAGALGLV